MPFVLSTAWIKPGKADVLREWYRELASRPEDVLPSLENEGIKQEAAFILDTEHGELLAVFIEVEDMDKANEAFYSSPFELDHKHREVMDEATVGGAGGRKFAELQYVFRRD
jgi:hypothetical protein